MKTAITYGTFDMFHVGHLRLLKRIRGLADRVVVAVSTDEFNALKGKQAVVPYSERKEIIEALSCVDLVIPETCWGQKPNDIRQHEVDVFVMGSDWAGRFDHLRELCDVMYLERTEGVSSTELRQSLVRLEISDSEIMKILQMLRVG